MRCDVLCGAALRVPLCCVAIRRDALRFGAARYTACAAARCVTKRRGVLRVALRGV